MRSKSLPRRLLSLVLAMAVLMVIAPLLPARAASDCDHMSMSAAMAMDMKMDMRSQPAKSENKPTKPGLPCGDGLNCLGSAGCCAQAIDQVSVVSLPNMAVADTDWTSRRAGPGIAHKPALPPPIARA